MAPGANPPVCRLLDFEEFLWSQRSKQQDARRRQVTQQRSGEVKQVGLTDCFAEAGRDPADEWHFLP